MKHRLFCIAACLLALVLLASCSAPADKGEETSPREEASGKAPDTGKQTEEKPSGGQKGPQDISVAGLSLQSDTPYRVYLEPTAACEPSFPPLYVTMEFADANTCFLTYDGKTVTLGRYKNDKYIDLFTLSDDPAEQFAINGKCDTDCPGADFAVRVSSFVQGEHSLLLFGNEPYIPQGPGPAPIPEEQPVYRLGNQSITKGETYLFRFVADEDCDKVFDPFSIPIKFFSERGVAFVTSQYKNVSSVYPAGVDMETSGWMEFSTGSGDIWGNIGKGTDGADMTFYVLGVTKNPGSFFKNLSPRPEPVPETTKTPQTKPPKETKPPETKPPETEPAPSADYDTKFYYYYGQLNEDEKVIYTQLSECLRTCGESVRLTRPISPEDFKHIWSYIHYDQPDLFWVSLSYRYRSSGGLVTEVLPGYNDLTDHLEQKKAEVEAVVQKLLAAVKGMRDWEAERYVHDYLINNAVYVTNRLIDQTLYSSLVVGETVCAGYSRAFQYIMQRLGIPCYFCVGVAGNDEKKESHAWNIVRIGGEWYNVDITWDDCQQEGRRLDFTSYEYYNVTDSFLSVEHTRREAGSLLPACTSTKSSFEKLYGYSWKAAVALEGGYTLVNSLDEYYKACYNALMKTGAGTTVTRFVITDEELFERIAGQGKSGEFKNGYMNAFFEASKLQGYYYSYAWKKSSWLSSRGGCYYVEIEHKVEK